jgi:sodium/potassium-transporting ATPase subunit alpha
VDRQWFTLMAIRTRRQSLLNHPPLFRRETANYFLFAAIAFAFLIALLFLYPVRLRLVLGSAPIPAAHWFLPMGFGAAILLLDEARKYFVRKYPNGFLARIAW